MARKLKNLIGRIEIRILLFLAFALVMSSFAYTAAQSWKSAASESAVQTVSSWDDVVKEYLVFRGRSYLLIVPTFAWELGQIEEIIKQNGLEVLQKSSDWYWTFDGGTILFDDDGEIAKQVKHGTEIVLYEDMVNQEILVLSATGENGTYEEEIVYRAPSWPEVGQNESYETYLLQEISKRRIAWHVTLKSSSIPEDEIEAPATEFEEGGSGESLRMMMWENEDYTNHLWLSILGPSMGFTNGLEIAAHWPAGYTNRLEIYTSTDLVAFTWAIAATNLITDSTDSVAWAESDIENIDVRYYVAGNADVDTDDDGLADAREKFLHHTDMTAWDSDVDAMPDGWEIQYGLNPSDPADAAGDADGDGLSNLLEFQLGTSPDNSADALAALNESRARIINYWNLIYPTPLSFTNAPGSAADLEDLKNALQELSGKFYHSKEK